MLTELNFARVTNFNILTKLASIEYLKTAYVLAKFALAKLFKFARLDKVAPNSTLLEHEI
jgi:hypothetical protein